MNRRTLLWPLLAAALLALGLAACAIPSEELATPTAAATAAPTAAATAAPTAAATAAPPAGDLPPAAFYDLGESTVIQANFATDSRFRQMPVRLNGVIAAPAPDGVTHPVAVILHGTHPGCPLDDAGVDRWPCDPAVEQRNYAGFEYLVRELAARGYVALAPNINAEYTFGFGEPVPGERLSQLLDQHLSALAGAAGSDTDDFGVPLGGVADMSRLALIGHSQGGEFSSLLTRQLGLDAPDALANHGYGPVAGLLLVAPSVNFVGSTGGTRPLAVILPVCDGDVLQLSGQHYFEALREQDEHPWATTVLLEGGNHNGFNAILGSDMITHQDRPDCQPLLAATAQRQFLVDYAADFLTAVLGDGAARTAALARLGVDPGQPPPTTLYGLPARVTSLPASADRRAIFTPSDAAGAANAQGATLFFCPPGYTVEAELAPCRRPNFVMPGDPRMVVISWTGPSQVVLTTPDAAADLSGFAALTLRAAVDPLSELNPAGAAQSFSVRLTDRGGASATVVAGPTEPALQYPAGVASEEGFFDNGSFSSPVHMTAVRLPLSAFAGVDLSDVAEVALVFDQTPSGTLFLADVEAAR